MFRILDPTSESGAATWLNLWQSWPDREVFAHPGYPSLFLGPGQRVFCASWESAEGNVLYPFIVRDLSKEPFVFAAGLGGCDIVTAYGYGGPFTWGEGKSRIAKGFWEVFAEWARSERIVTEFVRFALNSNGLLPYPGKVEERLKNVIRDLTTSEEAQWMEFEHKVRKNVKKAERSGISIEVDENGERIGDFLRIYHATMNRRGAAQGYFFERDFFEQLQRSLLGQFAYFHAMLAGKVVSTELILVSAGSVYSFLGGTDESAFNCRPNELIKLAIMRWARSRAKRAFVLGGGQSAEDGIFRYKRSFAPNGVVSFFVGQRVCDQEAEQQLVTARAAYERAQGREWTPDPFYFPVYRS